MMKTLLLSRQDIESLLTYELAWIGKGALVLGMGSYQQIEDAFALAADRVIVDSMEQASHRGELGNLMGTGKLARSAIYAELGEIVAGKKPGWNNGGERILMVPVGLGAHDVSIADVLCRNAQEKNIGALVSLM